MTIYMELVNNHFHDCAMTFIYNDKRFYGIVSLAQYLGNEYSDLDSDVWYSVTFVMNGMKIPYLEVLEY